MKQAIILFIGLIVLTCSIVLAAINSPLDEYVIISGTDNGTNNPNTYFQDPFYLPSYNFLNRHLIRRENAVIYSYNASGLPGISGLLPLTGKIKSTQNINISDKCNGPATPHGGIVSILKWKPGLIPTEYRLFKNYPSMSGEVTHIPFELESSCKVRLDVYDQQGKSSYLILDQHLCAGFYNLDFNSQSLTPGIYYIKLTADDTSLADKLLVR